MIKYIGRVSPGVILGSDWHNCGNVHVHGNRVIVIGSLKKKTEVIVIDSQIIVLVMHMYREAIK